MDEPSADENTNLGLVATATYEVILCPDEVSISDVPKNLGDKGIADNYVN